MKKLYLHLPSQGTEATEQILATITSTLSAHPCADATCTPAAAAEGSVCSCTGDAALSIDGVKVLGYYKDRVVATVDDAAATQLREAGSAASSLIAKHGYESFEKSEYVSLLGDGDALIGMEKGCLGMSLLLQSKMKPLVIDFEQLQYRQRLLRGGRQKEPLARAVMNGIEDGALVFDATAGLGRESMILAHAGAKVIGFERQLPIWIILKDALLRASKSRFFPFTLPELQAPGTMADYTGDAPEVIYYDPMFPEREKSAVVKKDMFLFRQVIGEDKDIEDFIRIALKLAKKRVVVKRPSTAEPVTAPDFERAYFVDGGQCRFDCYKPD